MWVHLIEAFYIFHLHEFLFLLLLFPFCCRGGIKHNSNNNNNNKTWSEHIFTFYIAYIERLLISVAKLYIRLGPWGRIWLVAHMKHVLEFLDWFMIHSKFRSKYSMMREQLLWLSLRFLGCKGRPLWDVPSRAQQGNFYGWRPWPSLRLSMKIRSSLFLLMGFYRRPGSALHETRKMILMKNFHFYQEKFRSASVESCIKVLVTSLMMMRYNKVNFICEDVSIMSYRLV